MEESLGFQPEIPAQEFSPLPLTQSSIQPSDLADHNT